MLRIQRTFLDSISLKLFYLLNIMIGLVIILLISLAATSRVTLSCLAPPPFHTASSDALGCRKQPIHINSPNQIRIDPCTRLIESDNVS